MMEIRCPECGRLLFKAMGYGSTIEVVCRTCKITIRWPSNRAEVVTQADAPYIAPKTGRRPNPR